MEGYQFDILLMLYYSSLKLISSLISYLKAAMHIIEVCLIECIDGLKLPNDHKYSSKGNVYNGLGGLFHLTIRPGSLNIYMWPYSFELYQRMRGSISFEHRMFFEWARFESFRKAPATLRMSIIKLAKYGFYYTGSGNNCKCAFCGLVYENWRYTDDPEDVHRRLSPNCPLVHDRMNTNNIPIIATEGLQGQSAAISLGRNCNHMAVCHHGYVSRYQDMPGPNVRDELQNRMSTIRIMHEQSNTVGRGSPQHVVEIQQAKYPTYNQLDTRIGTFGNWLNNNQSPRNLAQAGFYYAGIDDCCRCFCCGGGLRNWGPGDDPWVEHARWFPNCDFVRQCKGDEFVNRIQQLLIGPNVRNELQNLMITIRRFEEEFDAIRSVSMQHVVDMQQARNPNYVQLDTRIESFGNWPSSNQAPRNLAQAGFYYTGEDDCCRCFFCDGGVRQWEPGDDPWSEHARWFPNCDFVRIWKGDEFVNSIQLQAELNDPGDPSENDVNSVETSQLALITEIHRHTEGLKCLKCKTERICMMFIPCGHTITCEDCSKIIQRCFKCNKVVTKALKVLIP